MNFSGVRYWTLVNDKTFVEIENLTKIKSYIILSDQGHFILKNQSSLPFNKDDSLINLKFNLHTDSLLYVVGNFEDYFQIIEINFESQSFKSINSKILINKREITDSKINFFELVI